jgi:hypothetical protein
MNRINAAERKKVAAQYEGDAERILIVEKAKAEAESKRLQGTRNCRSEKRNCSWSGRVC